MDRLAVKEKTEGRTQRKERREEESKRREEPFCSYQTFLGLPLIPARLISMSGRVMFRKVTAEESRAS